MTRKVLIVDDEPGILATLSGVFSDEGYEVVTSATGEEAPGLYQSEGPDVVFLDIWLPDRDGLETLRTLRELDPGAAVVMMSGHGTAETAAKAIKMGARDFLEKPLSYNRAVRAMVEALDYRDSRSSGNSLRDSLEFNLPSAPRILDLHLPENLPQLTLSETPQRTLAAPKVLYGHGLHSNRRTGMALQPLPPDSGIHFLTVPDDVHIPAHVAHVAETDYATTLERDGVGIKTVEHLLSALHARGVTNLLVKVHGEIPVLDGSALEFCDALDEAGVVDQDAQRRELVIDRKYRIERAGGGFLTAEPHDGLEISYHLSYPEPVGEQSYRFALDDWQSYREEVAPARTFGFVRDLKMMAELGLAGGGRFDNCVLIGDGGPINTELRFPDELARHKALDILGDIYLLGFAVRGRIEGHLTGHRTNIALLREIAATG